MNNDSSAHLLTKKLTESLKAPAKTFTGSCWVAGVSEVKTFIGLELTWEIQPTAFEHNELTVKNNR